MSASNNQAQKIRKTPLDFSELLLNAESLPGHLTLGNEIDEEKPEATLLENEKLGWPK